MPDDFIVTIPNLSPFSWIELFFVADAGIPVGNADGKINGGDAFKEGGNPTADPAVALSPRVRPRPAAMA